MNPGPNIFKAIAAFQATNPVARMDGTNPHFRSKYITLEGVVEVARKATEHGLSVVQLVNGDELVTMLCHVSGEYLTASTKIVADKANAHGYGSGITYARRYALAAILGIVADVDDDGNAAAESTRKAKQSDEFKAGSMRWMFPRLKELGLTMDEVNAYTDACNRSRLSGMRKEAAQDLLKGLGAAGSDIRRHFDAWRMNNG